MVPLPPRLWDQRWPGSWMLQFPVNPSQQGCCKRRWVILSNYNLDPHPTLFRDFTICHHLRARLTCAFQEGQQWYPRLWAHECSEWHSILLKQQPKQSGGRMDFEPFVFCFGFYYYLYLFYIWFHIYFRQFLYGFFIFVKRFLYIPIIDYVNIF